MALHFRRRCLVIGDAALPISCGPAGDERNASGINPQHVVISGVAASSEPPRRAAACLLAHCAAPPSPPAAPVAPWPRSL